MGPDLQRRIAVARGDEPADLVVRGGKVLSVFTREWLETDVAVVDGWVAGLGDYEGRDSLDATGRWVVPGFPAATCRDPEGIQMTKLADFTGRWRIASMELWDTDAIDLISSAKVDLVVNTPRGRGPRADGAYIRTAANVHKIPCLTTIAAALAAAAGISDWSVHSLSVRSLQEFHEGDQLRLPL